MTTEVSIANIVKNKSTEQNRDFWSHVERVAAQSRNNRGATSNGAANDRLTKDSSTAAHGCSEDHAEEE